MVFDSHSLIEVKRTNQKYEQIVSQKRNSHLKKGTRECSIEIECELTYNVQSLLLVLFKEGFRGKEVREMGCKKRVLH